MTNCVREIYPDNWLTNPDLATYGNERNSYSSMYPPVVYDYLFYKTGSDDVTARTWYFWMPPLTFLHEGRELSISDHEAIAATIYVQKNDVGNTAAGSEK